MAIRLHYIVEGQTEETFVNQSLRPHLANFSIWVKARCVMTSRKCGVKRRGGIGKYAQAKKDIKTWIEKINTKIIGRNKSTKSGTPKLLVGFRGNLSFRIMPEKFNWGKKHNFGTIQVESAL